MFRKSSLLIAVLALVLVVPVANAAGWTIGVNGGLAKVTGDEGQDSKMGPMAGLDICMHVTEQFAVGAEGNWSRNKHKDVGTSEDLGGGDTATLDKDNLNIMSGGVHGKYMFPMNESPIAPYVLLGVGFYKAKEDYQVTITGPSAGVITDENDGVEDQGMRLGGKLGAGAVYKATEQVGISLQADYNLVTLDNGGVSGAPSNFKFFGVRAGLNFHIMPK